MFTCESMLGRCYSCRGGRATYEGDCMSYVYIDSQTSEYTISGRDNTF